jgi:hypothetical protein
MVAVLAQSSVSARSDQAERYVYDLTIRGIRTSADIPGGRQGEVNLLRQPDLVTRPGPLIYSELVPCRIGLGSRSGGSGRVPWHSIPSPLIQTQPGRAVRYRAPPVLRGHKLADVVSAQVAPPLESRGHTADGVLVTDDLQVMRLFPDKRSAVKKSACGIRPVPTHG